MKEQCAGGLPDETVGGVWLHISLCLLLVVSLLSGENPAVL